MSNNESLPRWDLNPIYPGFKTEEYAAAKAEFGRLCAEYEAHCAAAPVAGAFRAWLIEAIRLADAAGSLGETLGAYAYVSYSVDTRDKTAMAELNAVEELSLALKRAEVAFKNVLAANRAEAGALAESDPELSRYRFYIEEELLWQSRQMSPELEDLASDLSRSGGDAWGRLQETVSSTTGAIWDEASGERKTVVQLRALAFDSDRDVRRKAFEKELACWKGVETPMAAALNGVKGFTVTLNRRRGWEGALDKSIAQSRISRATLDALLAAMEEALPMWRRYLKAKARLIGVPSCAFFDLFAPVGGVGRSYSWAEARDIVVSKFSAFSPAMGAFASSAFGDGWIDAEPREGKVGGAYCIDFPRARVARVMCNFDGSFSSLSTVAHELGHAYHQHVLKDEPYALTHYPMTLAETASIFAETVVFEDALGTASGDERLGLLENHLQDGCQILVDILSRFYFERAVFERRGEGELSAQEFSELMLDAQRRTYGDGLDPELLHPYMWAVKGHYYSPALSFYNFPYAFGQLFGLGLYERYREEGPRFAETYRGILLETGRADAVRVCADAGFDIETPGFWRSGVASFSRQADEFERLVDAAKGMAR
ncbi:MAG: peptidase M3 [Spirochaetae bacterium HGW-Spirochaetae-3]|jgi:pepF/M3 family oligoendopeptidase|nr:MAG: peptidase M3 [Spirochaetae bacterium HGW-Spirochaetae-3]